MFQSFAAGFVAGGLVVGTLAYLYGKKIALDVATSVAKGEAFVATAKSDVTVIESVVTRVEDVAKKL